MRRARPELLEEIRRYGAFDIRACFNCGNCTAVCPLSRQDSSFPRRLIRAGQTGLEDELLSGLGPWDCHYCGECSQTCPRQAMPGEYMAAMRRWLIARYDVTGLSAFFYRNGWAQSAAAAALFGILLWLFSSYTGDFGLLAARIERFFPAYVTLAIAGYVLNMYRRTVGAGWRELLSLKPELLAAALKQAFTQPGFRTCGEPDTARWLGHLLVMTGYAVTLLISNLQLLEPLSRSYRPLEPLSLLIWFAGGSLTAGGLFMAARRIIKSAESSRFSHPSDWLFLVTLLLIGAGTLAVLLLNIAAGPHSPALEKIYKAHMAVETVWILLIVPFTKWIHIFFRPLAVYFGGLRSGLRKTV